MFQAKAKRRHHSNSKTLRSHAHQQRSREYRLRLESLEPRMMLSTTAGTWTPLANTNPAAQGMLELLSNGSVMVAGSAAQAWEQLTPSSTGSYVNATWSPLASMSETRLYDETAVLPNGNVMVLGGEYTSPPYTYNLTDTGEIYNPVTNAWTAMAPYPGQFHFGSAATAMLPNGDVLAGRTDGSTFIYDPPTNTWLTTGESYNAATGTWSTTPALTKPNLDESAGENWTQLANGNIMSVDIWKDVGQVEIFNTTTMSWSDAGPNTAPAGLVTAGGWLGPATLLPDGRVFQLGGQNSLTALYNPSTNTWAAGPTLPNGLETIQSSAAMMSNGDVLFAAGGATDGPIHYFEYNPTNNSLTDVSPAFSLTASSRPFVSHMLALPSGQVLVVVPGGAANTLYVYTPVGSPQAAWQPTITSVAADANGDGNYTLTGTQLNGLSAGASTGGSIEEMASNYPIVELTNSSGQVYFARTFNWSTTAVATGNTPETTQFSLPAGMPSGTYNLSVVANGIASSPLSSLSFSAVPTADLAVTDTGPSSLTAGTNATYTITLTNNGPGAATDVLLSDLLPAESTLVSFTQTSGSDSFTLSQPQTNVVAAAISSIPDGSSDTFILTVSAPTNLYNGDMFTNTATVSTNANDPVSSNNTATATDSIVNANHSSAFVVANVGLSGTLTTIAGPTGTIAEAGEAIYLFTVTNTGPIDAPPNTVLTDVLGSGMKFVSASYGDGGLGYSLSVPNEVLIDFGAIPVGQLVTAKVAVEYTGYGTLTNSASASNTSDLNTTTNTLVVNVTVPEAPIVVSAPITVTGKSVSNQVVATFTHANGVEPASNFVATINWGDNSTSTGTVTESGTTYTVKGSHTYAKNGSHTVTTTVVDPGGAVQNAMAMLASASIATTPAASTSMSVTTSTSANTATTAMTNSKTSDGMTSLGSTAPSSAKIYGAGAQPIADLDRLDALFELLSNSDSDPLQAGKSKGLLS